MRHRTAWSRVAWFIQPIHQTEFSKKDSPWSCEDERLASPSALASFPSAVPERWNWWTNSSPLLAWMEIWRKRKGFRWAWINMSREMDEGDVHILRKASAKQIDTVNWSATVHKCLLMCWLLIASHYANIFSIQLTDYSVVVVVLHTHGDIFHTEVHLDRFDAEISPVVVFLLIRICLEINFASDFLVVAPILAHTGGFDEKSEQGNVKEMELK